MCVVYVLDPGENKKENKTDCCWREQYKVKRDKRHQKYLEFREMRLIGGASRWD